MGFEPTRAGATILCLNHLTTAAILFFGAGEGDRTLATGLEGRGSTTELHPRGSFLGAKDGIRTRDPRLGKAMLYQLSHFRISTAYSKQFAAALEHHKPGASANARCNNIWWREKDLNLRRLCRRIYSPFPLATRASLHD